MTIDRLRKIPDAILTDVILLEADALDIFVGRKCYAQLLGEVISELVARQDETLDAQLLHVQFLFVSQAELPAQSIFQGVLLGDHLANNASMPIL